MTVVVADRQPMAAYCVQDPPTRQSEKSVEHGFSLNLPSSGLMDP